MKDEIKAGIIIVSSIAILSVFIILIGGSQFLDKFDTYSVKVMNAAGLEPGAQGGWCWEKSRKTSRGTAPGAEIHSAAATLLGSHAGEGLGRQGDRAAEHLCFHPFGADQPGIRHQE